MTPDLLTSRPRSSRGVPAAAARLTTVNSARSTVSAREFWPANPLPASPRPPLPAHRPRRARATVSDPQMRLRGTCHWLAVSQSMPSAPDWLEPESTTRRSTVGDLGVRCLLRRICRSRGTSDGTFAPKLAPHVHSLGLQEQRSLQHVSPGIHVRSRLTRTNSNSYDLLPHHTALVGVVMPSREPW
jgi:hypothetical protein